MQKNTRKLRPDQRLREIGHVLARGVLRMKDANQLLTRRSTGDDQDLQKPLKPVNQQVSG